MTCSAREVRRVRIVLFALPCLGLPLCAAALSVTDFGAVPDDSGDDLAAIQNTVNAASAGETVYFPGGTYRISGAIIVTKSAVRLEGTNTNGSVLLYVGGALSEMIGIGGVANVVVSHLTLDGNGSAAVKDGILAGGGSGHRFQNLVIRNFGNSPEGPRGIRFDPDVTDSTIVSNRIENIGTGSAWGAGIRLSWRSSRNRVTDNVISNTGRGGIFCNDQSTDNVICRNVVAGSGGARLGIEVWGACHRALIEDNRIDHWLSLDGSDFCAVRRNTVSDKSGLYAWAGLEGITRNSVFTDNIVDGGAQVGISQSNWPTKEYILWARNTIKASAMFGLLLGGADGPCQYQYFYRNTFLSSIGTQPPAQYSGTGDGMRFDQNCYFISFETNEISSNYHDGVWPMWARENLNYFSFTGNTIQNNGNGGVWDGFGNDLEWEDNIISGNHGGGADWNVQLTSRGFANQKPVAAFDCPEVVLPGATVSFSNTSWDADGTISRALWDFGDGLPSTNVHPEHVYANTGRYVVSLVVWDDGGRGALATRSVAVVTRPEISGATVSGDNLSLAITNLAITSSNNIRRSLNLLSSDWNVVTTFVAAAAYTNWSEQLTDTWSRVFFRIESY